MAPNNTGSSYSSSDHAAAAIDFSVTLAGSVQLTSCLYNASGPRSGTAEALRKVAASAAGAVLTKSATLTSQTGNPLPRTYHSADGQASFNSEGLPNAGIDYYISAETIREVMEGCENNSSKKPYIVSLSGKCLADNVEMLKRIAAAPTLAQISAIELNLACPNVIGKPIIGYDVDQMDDILRDIGAVIIECNAAAAVSTPPQLPLPPLGIKLPPYFDVSHFAAAAAVLNQHCDVVKYVATINTVGNALCIDGVNSEAPVIGSNGGYAGLSGPAIKYTALANVRKLRELLLSPQIDVVGVGGISTGQDVYDMLLAGATCCQTATTHWKEGPDCFDRIILQELGDILRKKGLHSVRQVTGGLKPWSKEGAALARQAAKERSGNKSDSTTTMSKSLLSPNNKDDAQFYKVLSAMLAVVLAILLADKYSGIRLLPTE